MPLVLNTLSRNPGLTSTDIDENWTDIEDFVNGLETQLQLGAVTITSATTDEQGRLVLGLSNGTNLPPVPLGSQPIRVLGDWQSGLDYIKGDIVSRDGSSYIVALAHESDDFDDDLTAGRLVILAAGAPGGGGGAGAIVQRFERLGSVAASGDDGPTIEIMVMPGALEISGDVVAAVGTALGDEGGFEIVLTKRAALNGAVTELGVLEFPTEADLATATIAGSFEAGDVLRVRQRWAGSLTEGEDLTVTVVLAPPSED